MNITHYRKFHEDTKMKCQECGASIESGTVCAECQKDIDRAHKWMTETSSIYRNLSMDRQGEIALDVARMLIKNRKKEMINGWVLKEEEK
jgi:hypothetical protein